MSNIVAIVGRPNVGKSTLFNRLTESRNAIVDETAGVTRDRHYGKVEWSGVEFSVIDTGGYVVNSDDIFEEEIRKQVQLAIEESDVILFLVDVRNGITDLDDAVADILRRSRKKVFVVVNKVDNSAQMIDTHQFHAFGLGELYTISSMTGSGTGELLDDLIAILPNKKEAIEEPEIPRFAIVGRPNVGKSSIINALLEQDQNIVTPVAGTTRDTILTRYQKFGHDFFLVDTAGLRKKGKVFEDIEFYSVMRSVRAIESSDVCLLVLDAERGVEAQDVNILQLIVKNRKGLVVLVNKWDLIEKDTHSAKLFEKTIREKFEPFTDIPIVFVSALTKQRILKALEEAISVFKARTQHIPTSKLNDVMLPEIEAHHPPATKGKYIRIKFVTQLKTHAPTFVFYANLPQYLKEDYRRYLENRLREHFNFKGVPIQILFRKK